MDSFPNNHSNPLSALAFDFGMQRIGVAFGQSLSGTAQPVVVMKAIDGIPDWQKIENLLVQWKPDVFVIGLPFNMDGGDSELLARARKFGNRLTGRFHKPCFGIDERLSSVAASEQLEEANGRQKKAAAIDDIAAQIILENWFAELRQQSR